MYTKYTAQSKTGLCLKALLLVLIIPSVSAATGNVTFENGTIARLVYDNAAQAYTDRGLENPNIVVNLCGNALENKYVRLVIRQDNTVQDITDCAGRVMTVHQNCTTVDIDLSTFWSLYPAIMSIELGDSSSFNNSTFLNLTESTGGLLDGSYNATFTENGNTVSITVTRAIDDKGSTITASGMPISVGVRGSTMDSAQTMIGNTVVLTKPPGSFSDGDYEIVVNGIIIGATRVITPSISSGSTGSSGIGRRKGEVPLPPRTPATEIAHPHSPEPSRPTETVPEVQKPSPIKMPEPPKIRLQWLRNLYSSARTLQGLLFLLAGFSILPFIFRERSRR